MSDVDYQVAVVVRHRNGSVYLGVLLRVVIEDKVLEVGDVS